VKRLQVVALQVVVDRYAEIRFYYFKSTNQRKYLQCSTQTFTDFITSTPTLYLSASTMSTQSWTITTPCTATTSSAAGDTLSFSNSADTES
jgi:hypothetical protein